MPEQDRNYDPYRTPTPYDILGVKGGIRATAKEIGKAYNKAKKKARLIKDSKERAARMEQLDWAKEQLLRADSRVMIDFFLLSDDLFVDLAVDFGRKLAEAPIPTKEAIGPLMPDRPYDDLVPRPLEQLLEEFRLPPALEWYDFDEPKERRLPLHESEH